VYRHGGDEQLAWEDITTLAPPLPFPEPQTRIFETEEGLGGYFTRVSGNPTQIASTDRARYLLTAVGPRSSSGYRLRVLRAVEERGRVVITLREETPGLSDQVEPRVTFPFILLALPTGDKPVRVKLVGRP
jgi:protease stability complex PrcB-like protein